MSKTLGKVSLLCVVIAMAWTLGCNNTAEQAPAPQLPQAQPQLPPAAAPVQPVAAVPTPPPPTPLMPVGDIEETPAPAASKSGVKSGGGGIDKPLPGKATTGDELVGAYTCRIDSKKLQIGPIKLPPFGCRIYKTSDGSLKVGSTSDGAGSLKGNVEDQTAAGFFITGKFEMSGNKLSVKAKMKLSGVGKYIGNGRGRLNDDKSAQISYKLTMTRN